MGIIVKVIRHSNADLSYLRNACRYGRDREIARGAFGVNPHDPEKQYAQMVTARKYFNQTSTNPLIHLVVSFDGKTDNAAFAIAAAPQLAAYFKANYQVLWSVHPADPESSHFHVHIMLNSVNLLNGKLFHSGPYEINGFAYHVKWITGMPYRIVFECFED